MSLKEYRRKRKFSKTPEPEPSSKKKSGRGPLHFVVQKHAASRVHYDFRLEIDGALKSWAVPRGPSLMSGDPRLAVKVEDHPLEYGKFEGVIPKGNYGAGTVMIWDRGTYVERKSEGRSDSEKALRDGLVQGHITFVLSGEKLRGEFALVKIKKKGAEENAWLLVKKHDAEASRRDVTRDDRSAATGRTMAEIASQSEKKGDIWLPRKGRSVPKTSVKTSVRIRPMEPVFASAPPKTADWIFEPFGAGVRAIAQVERGKVQLHSRTLLPLEKRYPQIVRCLSKLSGPVVLDGEIVDGNFVVADLLFLNGKDLRRTALRERKRLLSQQKFPAGIRVVESQTTPPPSRQVVAKQLQSLYSSGLTREWIRFRTLGSSIAERPPLTHRDKIFWPKERYTKGDLLDYYDSMADYILPYIVDKPQSLHRQPDGVRNEGFFHKDMTGYLPSRIRTERVFSESANKTVNYALCQDKWSLLYLVNLGCIELNPWLSRRGRLDNPDLIVIDLDPDDNPFKQIIQVAQEFHRLLDKVGAENYIKTSGATGLHICIPTQGRYDYDLGREFAEKLCRLVHQKFPSFTSIERNPAKRRGKIYLDFMQNRRAQTLAAPYCVRPRPGATVSTPLKWSEVKAGLNSAKFTIKTVPARVKKLGDLWKPMLTTRVDLRACLRQLSKLSNN